MGCPCVHVSMCPCVHVWSEKAPNTRASGRDKGCNRGTEKDIDSVGQSTKRSNANGPGDVGDDLVLALAALESLVVGHGSKVAHRVERDPRVAEDPVEDGLDPLAEEEEGGCGGSTHLVVVCQ